MGTPHDLGTPNTILLVEDEYLLRLMTGESLREAGYKVFEASNADDAVEMMSEALPHLVVTDVRMPGQLDGLGLLNYVREAYPALPVIVVSGHMMNLERSDDTTYFLPKPYPFGRLSEVIKIALATSG